MQRISKPHLVDLLRYFDRRRAFCPRIRYASVRSKPELCRDLAVHFHTYCLPGEHVLHFRARDEKSTLPEIAYDLKARQFLFDQKPFDVPKQSRKREVFSISHVPVTLHFAM